jgi:hypothetical protein
MPRRANPVVLAVSSLISLSFKWSCTRELVLTCRCWRSRRSMWTKLFSVDSFWFKMGTQHGRRHVCDTLLLALFGTQGIVIQARQQVIWLRREIGTGGVCLFLKLALHQGCWSRQRTCVDAHSNARLCCKNWWSYRAVKPLRLKHRASCYRLYLFHSQIFIIWLFY